MRIVVTGGQGFVGRRLAARLAADGHEVLAVDRVPPASSPAGVRIHTADVTDAASLLPPGWGGEFVLIHLAWDLRRAGGHYAGQALQLNLLAGLLDHWVGRGLSGMIGMGSSEEYGPRAGTAQEDDLPAFPMTPYGWAKRAAGLLAASKLDAAGLGLWWLRPFIVYGPGQGGDMAIPYALREALAGHPAEFTDGLQERDFIHVDDVVAAIACALKRGFHGIRIVNLGTGRPVQLRAVLEAMGRQLNALDRFAFGARPRRAGEPDRLVAASAHAEQVLGWRAAISWEDGIRKMCDEAQRA